MLQLPKQITLIYQDENGRPPTTLLSVRNPANREIIHEYLPDNLLITEGIEEIYDTAFDICIIDDYTLSANLDALRKRKETAAPVFLPVLLLSQNHKATRQNHKVFNFVDDVIYIPTSTNVLHSRIELLLKTRKYSLDLEQKNRKLEQQNNKLQLFEKALNSTNAGAIITDANREDNPIIFCNEGFEQITGYRKEEILGRNCRFLQNGDRDQAQIDRIRFLLKNGVEGTALLRNYRKDGTLFWNELSIAPIRDSNNNITHFVGIQKDVTELVETQKKLKKEKEKFRLITENATDMISRHSPDGTYLYVSPASLHVKGYKPDELLGKSAFDLIHPDDLNAVKVKINEMMNNPAVETTTAIYRTRTPEGSYRWMESTARAVRNEFNNRVELQASHRNITHRKELEEKLKFHSKLLDEIGEAAIATDREGKIIYWNQAAEKMYGWKESEVLDRPVVKITSAISSKNKGREILNELQKGNRWSGKFVVRRKDGSKFTALVTDTPVFGEDGNLIAIIGVSKDITEQLHYEKQLKNSLIEKDTLLQEIHHRVKNNLAVVSSLLQMQIFNSDDENVRRLLSDSERRIKTMALIHENLYQSQSLSAIDFKSYITNLIGNIKILVDDEKNIEINIQVDPFELNVNQAVPAALILNEVVSNAFEHAFAGRIKGKIAIQAAQKNDMIHIDVSDDGIGLPGDPDIDYDESLGFTIIKTLTKQLEADLDISVDNGTNISFKFKKQNLKGSSSNIV